jgi:hypothetical protein
MVALSGLDQLAVAVANLASFKPEVLDSFDEREWIEEYSDGLGTPPKILRDKKVVAAAQAERAKQAASEKQMEQVAQGSQALKNIGSTQMGQSSALDALMGGVTQ